MRVVRGAFECFFGGVWVPWGGKIQGFGDTEFIVCHFLFSCFSRWWVILALSPQALGWVANKTATGAGEGRIESELDDVFKPDRAR